MAIERAIVLGKMRLAIAKGLSVTPFITRMRKEGLVYPLKTMRADWRYLKEQHDKAGKLRFIRKDRYPTEKTIASFGLHIEKEFMYVVRIKTQLKPDEPVDEYMISIQTDVPMTPAMIEERVIEERAKEERYFGEILIETMPWTAVRRAAE